MTSERQFKANLQAYVGEHYRNVRLFNNPVGVGRDLHNATRITHYGLCVGSGDLIGWRSIVITPEMVGMTIAQFVSVETKKPKGGHATQQQINWRNIVNQHGGIAGIVRTINEANELLEKKHNG